MPSYVIGLDLGSSCVKAAVLKGSLRGYEVEDFLSLEPSAAVAGEQTVETPDPLQGPAGLSPRAEQGADDSADDSWDEDESQEDDTGDGADDAEDEDEDAGAIRRSTASVVPVDTPLMAAARKVLAAVGHAQALVVASVPAERASAWQIDLPFSDRNRIEQTIGFELENYVPWDLEDVVLDYEVLEGADDGSRVFAVMVQRERIAELLDRLTRLEIDPRYVAVDAAELSRLVPVSERSEAVLDIGATRTLVCVVQQGKPQWIRSLDIGAEDFGEEGDLSLWLREVRASLIAAEESGAPPIDAVQLCGGGSRREGLLEQLEEELGVEAEVLQLPESPVNPDMAPRPEPEHALCYALALKGFAGKAEAGTNLRQGEFGWKADSRLYTRLAFAAVAAVALLCVGFVAMHVVNLAKLGGQLEDANQQLTDSVLQNFPTVSPSAVMTPDGAIGVMQEQVLAVQWRVEALEGHETTPLEALKELSDTVPSNILVDIDEYLANNEMIRIRGNTDSFGSVDRIEAEILANPKFKGAKKSDVNKARDGKMRFVMTIPRVQEEEVYQ
jgi:type II secretion system protein L